MQPPAPMPPGPSPPPHFGRPAATVVACVTVDRLPSRAAPPRAAFTIAAAGYCSEQEEPSP
jgi:hypothetical protein